MNERGSAAWSARLRRMRREEPAPTGAPAAPVGDAIAELGVHSRTNPRGRYFATRSVHGLAERHGDFPLGEALTADPEAFFLLTGDRALRALALRDAVFLDIETTGLSGGAGTVVFQVGLGAFVTGAAGEPEFELWQGLCGGHDDEPALLADVAARLAAAPAVVTFFGKTFDRHRLEDKMRFHGIAPPFAALAHLDLYHPLRRLHRGVFPDGRLRTLEGALCAVERRDDLPGALAPAAWFDFLAGRAHRLADVLRHNRDDVLSLVVLAAWLGRTIAGRTTGGGALAGSGARVELALAEGAWSAGRRPLPGEWERRLAACPLEELDDARRERLERLRARQRAASSRRVK